MLSDKSSAIEKSSSGISLRKMMASDIDQVVINENLAYEFPWTRGLFESNSKRHFCIVAVDTETEQVVGHGLLSIIVDEAHVLNIAVIPAAQRRGVGRLMLQRLLDHATEGNCVEVFLEVRESNRPAFTLYQSLGFNEIGIRNNYYPAKNGREDAILLACVL